jgi:hypothetical protein
MTKFLTAALLAAGLVALPSLALADDLTFQLTNNSSFTITNFYTSPASTDDWEEDVFGDGVFPSGNTVSVTIANSDGQCDYDMKFVPEGAAEFVVESIDICALDGQAYELSDASEG